MTIHGFIQGMMLLPAALSTMLSGSLTPAEFASNRGNQPTRRILLGQGFFGSYQRFFMAAIYCGIILGPSMAHRLPGVPIEWVSVGAMGVLVGLRYLTRAEQRLRLSSSSQSTLIWILVSKIALLGVIGLWAGIIPAALLFGAMMAIIVAESATTFAALEDSRRESSDAAWRTRLGPHFLFNTLNTLGAQIGKDPSRAQATTEQLGRLFRQLLTLSQKATVPLKEELEFVEDLLALHRARLGSRLKVSIEIPEELEDMELPTLALQTLVENALKHGIEPRERGGELRISARSETTYGSFNNFTDLLLTVENPLAESSQAGTGTGLESLRARMRKAKDLEIQQSSDTFRATMRWQQA